VALVVGLVVEAGEAAADAARVVDFAEDFYGVGDFCGPELGGGFVMVGVVDIVGITHTLPPLPLILPNIPTTIPPPQHRLKIRIIRIRRLHTTLQIILPINKPLRLSVNHIHNLIPLHPLPDTHQKRYRKSHELPLFVVVLAVDHDELHPLLYGVGEVGG
jgi:hypothetical protein